MLEVNLDVKNAGGNLNKNTSIRLGDTLDELIDQYAAFMNIDRSKVIRTVLMEGLFQKTKAAQFQHFEDWLAK